MFKQSSIKHVLQLKLFCLYIVYLKCILSVTKNVQVLGVIILLTVMYKLFYNVI